MRVNVNVSRIGIFVRSEDARREVLHMTPAKRQAWTECSRESMQLPRSSLRSSLLHQHTLPISMLQR